MIGGGGFLGQHIVEELLARGHSVCVFDLRTTFQDDRVTCYSGDLCSKQPLCYSSHTHTHTRLVALFPGLLGWAGTRKVKPIWILLKQETVSGSGISWAVCKSAPRSRQITTPTPHRSVFLQAGCPSCRPTNSVKALKATNYSIHCIQNWYS